ncbi:MAG: phospho-sugar mutase [Bacilli bacterium]|nr:phospho-sugar mutase [Bacilli bacterium]
MKIIEKYHEWLNSEFIKEEDRKILEDMTDEEIEEAFCKDLEFGTAGIRGIMGVGTNRMNTYNIGKVTLGLANYLNKHYPNPSVVIGYDTRHNSREFAFKTALVLNHEGIKTYIFRDITSTPEVSFAVKYLKTTSGIVITSSHNAKIYNGYKVYNNKGGQIVPPEDDEIIKEVNSITDYNIIKEAPLNNPLFNYLDKTIDEEFNEENEKVIIDRELIERNASKLKITYTSFHGTGIRVVPFILEKFGIRYNLVNEQCKIDPDFTYAPEPNPEYEFNYDLPKKYAKELGSDIILASDPDSDRMGVLYKSGNDYKMLSGNMIGSVFTYYLLNNLKIVKGNYIVRSIVSTSLVDKIADYNNAKVVEVLTGCKNIAKVKENDPDNYLFGFEESLGYMFNININDKNTFSASIFLIEILCYLKENGRTLEDYIEEIYSKYGYYETKTDSIVYEGIDGPEKMKAIMEKLRKENIFNEQERIDYKNRKDDLKTNAIKFIMNENEYFMIRPSGTEPKIKVYYIVNDINHQEAQSRLNKLISTVTQELGQ